MSIMEECRNVLGGSKNPLLNNFKWSVLLKE